MKRAGLLTLLLLGVGLGGNTTCNVPRVKILSPEPGQLVDACSVTVQVRLLDFIDPGTLEVTLNGQPLAMTEVGPGDGPLNFQSVLYEGEASIDFPLLANNEVLATVLNEDGELRFHQRSFDFTAAEPRARQITDAADLITGPQGDSRIGDWLLENCTARFVVQDAPQRDLTGIGQYGGNLIDAELRSRPGRDSFFEFQPMLNIETVINADTVTVVNDGTDGNPAIVRSCGPDDVLDYINANTLVDDLLGPGSYPANADDVDLPITGCTEFILAAGDRYVEVTTTVDNLDADEDQCIFVGDYMNGSGELEQWTSDPDGLNPVGTVSGIGEMNATFGIGVFGYFGNHDAEGVDYGYIPITSSPPGCLPTNPPGASSSFTTTGVSAVLNSTSVITTLFLSFPPVFPVPAGGSNSFTRYFAVGDGSLANSVDVEIEVKGLDFGTLEGCVTVGGQPAPGARVVAGILNVAGTEYVELGSHWVTGDDGCYSGRLRVGDYDVAAGMQGTLYEGGGAGPTFHPVTITSGGSVTQDIALPATGGLAVNVVNQDGEAIPARVVVVGNDPSPEITYSSSVAGALDLNTSTFHDVFQDSIPQGLTWVAYTESDGTTSFDIEPGTYDVVVSRGTEYSAFTAAGVVVAAGAPTVVNAQIAPVVDTTGFVSSDFHLHLAPSSDSGISRKRKVRAFAGEGVDNMVVTDHDRHTDLTPTIAELGMTPFVYATVGEEITTFDYGHFNAYPLGIDPDRVTHGSTDWAGAAPVGQGFPSSVPPAYALLPSEVFQAVFDTQQVAGGPLNTSPEIAVQINHIGSHYSPLKIDTGDPPLRTQLSPAERAARRFDPAATDTDFFHVFTALEIWNGFSRGHQSEFLDDRIGIWANLLNQGIEITAIYDTDSHDFFTTRQGGARSWTPSSTDAPASIDPDEVGAAVKAGKVVGGQGVYPQARLFATNAPANQADFSLAGSTAITVLDGEVTFEIDVQAPTWAPYDTIEIYANPSTVVTGTNGGVPVLYTACPTQTLESFEADFAVSVVDVHPSVAGAERLETTVSRSFVLTEDTWFAAVVKGTDANSASMFPVMAASVGSNGGVRALGATNALYVDVDGNGEYDGPGPQVVGSCP